MQGLSPGTPALRNGGGVKELAKEPEKEWSVKEEGTQRSVMSKEPSKESA